ncbi:hypothetical protein [Lysobacter sp. cf310]|uniref:hypothetical protein n=1 Tax=Lysobacter sp. cf310 TaxID=1761790 RepID=UPI000B861AE1|nr:hypothetical protein [Lysobacter sp. cf310]
MRHLGRIAVGVLAVLALLLPSGLQAMVWTPINLWVALTAILVFVVLAVLVPGLKWPSAAVASLPIAVAPYPNWIWASNGRGWHLHIGYKLQHLQDYAIEFLVLYLIVLMLFLSLFWAVRKRPDGTKGES